MLRLTLATLVVTSLCRCAPDTEEVGAGGGGGGVLRGSNGATQTHALEVSGGTVQVLNDGKTVAVSDGDDARVWLVDTVHAKVTQKISLAAGTAPGRMAVAEDGTLYVALRGTGEVALIDSSRKELKSTLAVCGDPRGLSWDRTAQLMRVACADGTLAGIAVDGTVSTQRVATDLRDVLVTNEGLKTTTFRAAKVIDVAGRDTTQLRSGVLSGADQQTPSMFAPGVAWRSIVAQDGSIVVTHQLAVDGPVENLRPAPPAGAPPNQGAYASAAVDQPCAPPCSSPVVRSAVSVLSANGDAQLIEVGGVLPVDVAVSPDGKQYAVALFGSDRVDRVTLGGQPGIVACAPPPTAGAILTPRPDGVAYLPSGALVVHSAVPNQVSVTSPDGTSTEVIALSPGLADVGQTFFHTPVNALACASCHPEGRDDGHVWTVAGNARRTPSLAGGLLATAPFHWEGNLPDIDALVEDTFVKRMGGVKPDSKTVGALADWLDGVPRPARTSTLSLKQLHRGELVFEGAGCTGCHSGATLTSSATLDVGTGGKFQVPSLRGVGSRAPFLHDGRAMTLQDRFKPMGGGNAHGFTSELDDEQVGLLTGYLESL